MRQSLNYKNGKIYVIRNHINELVYVGSTTQPLYKRFSWHKCSMRKVRCQNYKIYKAMREIGEEHFYIELVEEYPCDNIEQLHKREGHWIRELNTYNNGYNGLIAGRTIKEHYEDNREKLAEYHKEWYEKNKEIICQKKKEYHNKNRERHLEQRKEYYFKNREKELERNIAYNHKNKEKLAEYYKKRYAENKEKIAEKNKQKVECEVCNCKIRYDSVSRHNQSKKHLKNLN